MASSAFSQGWLTSRRRSRYILVGIVLISVFVGSWWCGVSVPPACPVLTNNTEDLSLRATCQFKGMDTKSPEKSFPYLWTCLDSYDSYMYNGNVTQTHFMGDEYLTNAVKHQQRTGALRGDFQERSRYRGGEQKTDNVTRSRQQRKPKPWDRSQQGRSLTELGCNASKPQA